MTKLVNDHIVNTTMNFNSSLKTLFRLLKLPCKLPDFRTILTYLRNLFVLPNLISECVRASFSLRRLSFLAGPT